MTFKNKTFGVLTGGGTDSLDGFSYITPEALTVEDTAYGIVNGLYHPYHYDPTLVIAANNSPYQIIPADNVTGTGAWVLGGYQGQVSRVSANRSTIQAIAASTPVTMIFNNEVEDALGEYDNTTGIFTADGDKRLIISGGVLSDNQNWTVGQFWSTRIEVNGTQRISGFRATAHTTGLFLLDSIFSGEVTVLDGQTVKVIVEQNRGPTDTLADAVFNWLTIDEKI